jgi:hypothetical protein
LRYGWKRMDGSGHERDRTPKAIKRTVYQIVAQMRRLSNGVYQCPAYGSEVPPSRRRNRD